MTVIHLKMGLLLYSLALVTLLVILWKISSAARYWIKYTIFFLVCIMSACLPIPLMLLKPRDSRNALIPAAGLRASLSFLGLKYTVEGHENIVKNSGSVILINHQSFLDLIILAYIWPIMPNCTVISKKEIFYLQPFGLASWLWGTIFIDRVKPKDAQKAINKTGETIKTRKARVLMFPEGTRNSGKTLLPFKKGAFHLAVASQCPIQPVAVSRYTFLGKNRFDDGHVTMRILPPISTEGYKNEDIPKLMEESYKIMSENVNQISASDLQNGTSEKVK
ncbi:1-acyl-sn-glycerol-3-phosphate acyltransferase alpha isoform X1 [Leptinotarsa decemlineata]|uniref:1-acyl-sn-glycerol-3-phosphate acyltransferase alpha isoform X1 n=2 Tax=Leptinotarsa decemlineata TaxID=7539 RepID=UPI003D30870B